MRQCREADEGSFAIFNCHDLLAHGQDAIRVISQSFGSKNVDGKLLSDLIVLWRNFLGNEADVPGVLRSSNASQSRYARLKSFPTRSVKQAEEFCSPANNSRTDRN